MRISQHIFIICTKKKSAAHSFPRWISKLRRRRTTTIIIQHQFWDLKVGDDVFGISLSFDNQLAELTVPYAALSAFVDPSVKFGLQFNAEETAYAPDGVSGAPRSSSNVPAVREAGDLAPVPESAADNDSGEEVSKTTAEVVNLETFRKK